MYGKLILFLSIPFLACLAAVIFIAFWEFNCAMADKARK